LPLIELEAVRVVHVAISKPNNLEQLVSIAWEVLAKRWRVMRWV
jgi:hypothetical protein